MRPEVSVAWRTSKGWMAGLILGWGIGCGRSLGYFSAHSARFGAAKGVTEGGFGTHGGGLGLEDGKEGGEEGELDAGDGGEAEEAVFDLGEELGVGGVVRSRGHGG